MSEIKLKPGPAATCLFECLFIDEEIAGKEALDRLIGERIAHPPHGPLVRVVMCSNQMGKATRAKEKKRGD